MKREPEIIRRPALPVPAKAAPPKAAEPKPPKPGKVPIPAKQTFTLDLSPTLSAMLKPRLDGKTENEQTGEILSLIHEALQPRAPGPRGNDFGIQFCMSLRRLLLENTPDALAHAKTLLDSRIREMSPRTKTAARWQSFCGVVRTLLKYPERLPPERLAVVVAAENAIKALPSTGNDQRTAPIEGPIA